MQSEFDKKEVDVFIVLGFSAKVIKSILRENVQLKRVVVIEPNAERFEEVVSDNDSHSLSKERRLKLIVGKSPIEVFAELVEDLSLYIWTKPDFVVSDSAKEFLSGYCKELEPLIEDAYLTATARINDITRTGHIMIKNSLELFEEQLNSVGIKTLFEKFKDADAFIVSAGPSLNKNVDQLKRIGDKGLILCVDTAAPVLAAKGIKPHLILTGDFRDKSQYFSDLNWNDVPLVFHGEVSPATVKAYLGPKLVLSSTNPLLAWIDSLGDSKGFFERGMSVAHTAFNCALELGCQKVIFVGQDFAFAEDSAYAEGTGSEGEEGRNQGKAQKVTSLYDGKELDTKEEFYIYLRYLEKRIAKTGIECINATEGGAGIRGTKVQMLESVINELSVSYNLRERIKQALKTKLVIDRDLVNKKINELKSSVDLVVGESESVVNNLQKAFSLKHDNDRAQEVVEHIDLMRGSAKIVSQHEEILRILHADIMVAFMRMQEAPIVEPHGFDNIEQVFKEDYEFHKAVYEGALFLQEVLNNI